MLERRSAEPCFRCDLLLPSSSPLLTSESTGAVLWRFKLLVLVVVEVLLLLLLLGDATRVDFKFFNF